MPVTDPDTRRKLADRMNRERVRRQLGTWDDVAREMGISSALLRGIRNGRAPITYESEVAIERVYGWPEGTVRGLLSSDAPAPKEWSADQRAKWHSMTVDEIIEEGSQIGKELGMPARIRYLRAALQEKETQLSPEDIRH